MFPAHEPGTVLIANGLAGMGFALPTAIAAKLVSPGATSSRSRATAAFSMNCQELETAVRLKTADRQRDLGEPAVRLDRVEAGQEVRPPLRRRLRPTDFVKLAEAFGAPAWRCNSADEFSQRLTHALSLDVPSVIVVPIDYSVDVAISQELGAETVAT